MWLVFAQDIANNPVDMSSGLVVMIGGVASAVHVVIAKEDGGAPTMCLAKTKLLNEASRKRACPIQVKKRLQT